MISIRNVYGGFELLKNVLENKSLKYFWDRSNDQSNNELFKLLAIFDKPEIEFEYKNEQEFYDQTYESTYYSISPMKGEHNIVE